MDWKIILHKIYGLLCKYFTKAGNPLIRENIPILLVIKSDLKLDVGLLPFFTDSAPKRQTNAGAYNIYGKSSILTNVFSSANITLLQSWFTFLHKVQLSLSVIFCYQYLFSGNSAPNSSSF